MFLDRVFLGLGWVFSCMTLWEMDDGVWLLLLRFRHRVVDLLRFLKSYVW